MQRRQMPRRQTGLSVKGIVFYRDTILLLQKNDRDGRCPWEFPGGGLRYGEDFIRGLHREIGEETGLAVDVLGPIGVWNYRRTRWHHLTGMMFICRAQTDTVRLSEEHRAYRWIDPADLGSYPLHDSLRRALGRLRPQELMQAGRLSAALIQGREK